MTHTPGPWFDRGFAVHSESGDLIAQVYDAHVDAAGNARLIGKAPVMLAELEQIAEAGRRAQAIIDAIEAA